MAAGNDLIRLPQTFYNGVVLMIVVWLGFGVLTRFERDIGRVNMSKKCKLCGRWVKRLDDEGLCPHCHFKKLKKENPNITVYESGESI
jgi:DNA-directed RNA polymerase subunit RPC12/RpoP